MHILAFTKNLSYTVSIDASVYTVSTETIQVFEVKLNNNDPCEPEKRFNITDTIVDISCGNDILFNSLMIKGSSTVNVCSVYISGGEKLFIVWKERWGVS
jgi:hypothetical protein